MGGHVGFAFDGGKMPLAESGSFAIAQDKLRCSPRYFARRMGLCLKVVAKVCSVILAMASSEGALVSGVGWKPDSLVGSACRL